MIGRLGTILIGGALLSAACKEPSGVRTGRAAVPKTENDKTFYALGLTLGRNLTPFNMSPFELELVKQGLTDSMTGAKPAVDRDTYGSKIDALARARSAAAAEVQKAKAKPFLEAAAKEPGAVKTSSGLIFRTLKPGTGASPNATDKVKVHYHGTLIDGTVFDSSVKRGQSAEFRLTGVIPCWTEGVQKMKVGEKAKLICPSTIAYGDLNKIGIPGGATLVFEIELLDIVK